MAKGTHLGWAKPDDPIYSGGPMISFRPPSPESMQCTATGMDGRLQAETNGRQRKPGLSLITSDSPSLDPREPAALSLEEGLQKQIAERNRGATEPSQQSASTTRKPRGNK
jgi:hypothetical protein